MIEVTIKKGTQAQALVALFNGARRLLSTGNLPIAVASGLLKTNPYVDYHIGRCIKVNFKTEHLLLHKYDRDNGQGRGVQLLREAGLIDETQ